MVVLDRLCMQVNDFSFSRPWWTIRRGLVKWQRSELEQSSNDTDTDTRLPSAMCDGRKKGYGSLLLCSLVGGANFATNSHSTAVKEWVGGGGSEDVTQR